MAFDIVAFLEELIAKLSELVEMLKGFLNKTPAEEGTTEEVVEA